METQQPHKDPPYGSNKVKVTILASEWGSSKGGLSTINRELAIQLAKCAEAEITFFLPRCSEEDKNIALSHNINIVEATRRPAYEELDWLSFPPEELKVDVIVGHGVKLGRQAQIIRDSHKCRWVQVVHTDPEELGMFKLYSNPISKGAEKHKDEVELCEMADLVVGIGPKLTEAFRRYLRGCGKNQSIYDFTPGIFDEFQNVQEVCNGGQKFQILVFGRGDAEDFALKGFDIAGKAVASLPNTHLVFVGAPDGKHEEIAACLLECGIPRNRLRVRGYVNSRESLKSLFFQVDVVLMPSRTEGFGLTGLEALSAGLPVLISRNSGFGQALSKVPCGSFFVIDSEEPQVWAAAIQQIRDKDRQQQLEEAETLRTSYDKKYSWAKQSKVLLQKLIDLTHVVVHATSDDSSSHIVRSTSRVVKRKKPQRSVKTVSEAPRGTLRSGGLEAVDVDRNVQSVTKRRKLGGTDDQSTSAAVVHGTSDDSTSSAMKRKKPKASVNTVSEAPRGTLRSGDHPVKPGVPENEVLEELSQQIGEAWTSLGRRLKFSDAELEGFNNDYKKYSEKAYQMMLCWKQREGHLAATYQVLSDALRHHLVGKTSLAEKFCCK